jgi:hypothetical protein
MYTCICTSTNSKSVGKHLNWRHTIGQACVISLPHGSVVMQYMIIQKYILSCMTYTVLIRHEDDNFEVLGIHSEEL